MPSPSVERPTVERGSVTGSITGGGGGGGPAPTNISEFIDQLLPTHRWKCDESAGPTVFDSGNGTTRDLTVVGTLLFDQGGPDGSSQSIDGNSSSDWARNSVGGMDPAASGTLFAFVRNPSLGGIIITQGGTVNEVNQIAGWLRRPTQGAAPTPRIGFKAFLANAFERRVWEGSTDVTSHNADNLWHLYGWVQEGLGTLPKMFIDGVEESPVISNSFGSTPPPIDQWTDIADANSRVVMFNGRFSTAASNYTAQASEICVLNNVIMTEAQFAALFAFVTN